MVNLPSSLQLASQRGDLSCVIGVRLRNILQEASTECSVLNATSLVTEWFCEPHRGSSTLLNLAFVGGAGQTGLKTVAELRRTQ